MDAKKELLDKAAARCSPSNYAGLAARLGVTRQSISCWKQGKAPLPDARIVELCAIAHEDPADWLVRIHVSEGGPVGAAWARVAKRLGMAASVALAALLPFVLAVGVGTAQAGTGDTAQNSRTVMIMSRLAKLLRELARARHLRHSPTYGVPSNAAAAVLS